MEGVREWKKIWQGGEGRATDGFGLCQYWPGLWCGGVSSIFTSFRVALMSVLVYAGAAQFAMISDCSPFFDLNMALTVCLINLQTASDEVCIRRLTLRMLVSLHH